MIKDATLHTLRSWLVIVSFVLMIAVVIFQWFEIDKYQIQDHMVKTIKSLFVSDEPAAPAAPAPDQAAAPAAPAAAAPAAPPAP